MPNFPRLLYYLFTAMKRLYWDKASLRRYQEKRLRFVIRYAYEFVPFYHEKFKKAGISPDNIKTMEDLGKLPITSKDELRSENPARLLSCRPRAGKLKILMTSGSTGKPLIFYVTRREDEWRKAIYLRANISCGQGPRDLWAVITAPRHFHETTNVQRRLGIYAQTCISVFSNIDEQVKFINRVKPNVLDGYSGAISLVARYIHERGIEAVKPKMIFGSAELIDTASCKFIEKVFNAPYYDQFGCIEVDRTAWQCPKKVGYHMDVDSVITEFIDRDGNNVSVGESGEIVYTSLFNYAMPFIRYSVGDVGKPSDEACPCGRTLPLMKVVEGRKDSLIVLPDGQVLSPRAFCVAMSMFSNYERIEQFRIVQKKPDFFEFIIKKKDNSVNQEVMEKELINHFRKLLKLGDDLRFCVRFVNDIPLSKSGKLMAVLSEVKPNL